MAPTKFEEIYDMIQVPPQYHSDEASAWMAGWNAAVETGKKLLKEQEDKIDEIKYELWEISMGDDL